MNGRAGKCCPDHHVDERAKCCAICPMTGVRLVSLERAELARQRWDGNPPTPMTDEQARIVRAALGAITPSRLRPGVRPLAA